MRIHVGRVGARCASCGCDEFHPGEGTGSELVCFNCGAHTTYSALLAQIADETVRQADRFLERLKKAREHGTQ